jgi:hypothetical protein
VGVQTTYLDFQVSHALMVSFFFLGYQPFLIGLCPGFVHIHLGDQSTSKDLKLLAIASHFGPHFPQTGVRSFLHGLHFF